MSDWICYHKDFHWDDKEIIAYFNDQNTAAHDTLSRLHVIAGRIALKSSDGVDMLFEQDGQTPLLNGVRLVSVSSDFHCHCAHYCLPEEYTNKKYGMTKTHSEVIAAARSLTPDTALDLGCGSGRNALYLHKLGWNVTALDCSLPAIERLRAITAEESLSLFRPEIYDINMALLTGTYQWVFSTVVMMFLSPDRVPHVIKNMQAVTKTGGYNLIVSAMSTADCPCPLPFPFTFQSRELESYYRDWNILKYNENMGELHKKDADGNRFKLRFVTLLAQKIAQ